MEEVKHDLSHSEQCRIAGEGIAQLFATVKADLTSIEANLWIREITRLGPKLALSFTEFWMSGGGQGDYRRAPRIDDFLRRADPEHVSAEDALEVLRAEVARCGPYNTPKIENMKLKAAVVRLGGWAKVCLDMPEPSNDFAFKRFAERFRSAWIFSESLQVQNKLSDVPLLSLSAAPNQLLLSAGVSEEVLPVPQFD